MSHTSNPSILTVAETFSASTLMLTSTRAPEFRKASNEAAHTFLALAGDDEIFGMVSLERSPLHLDTHVEERLQPRINAAEALGILRATKLSPPRELSWFNSTPLQAHIP